MPALAADCPESLADCTANGNRGARLMSGGLITILYLSLAEVETYISQMGSGELDRKAQWTVTYYESIGSSILLGGSIVAATSATACVFGPRGRR